MLHHSLTKDGVVADWSAIRRYHMEVNGWREIGYHFGVELLGEGYLVQLGRSLSEVGAHCKEAHMNKQAIGVCVVGNFDLAPPPHTQITVLKELVLNLLQFLVPLPSTDISDRILLHRQFAPYKSCPGRLFPVQDFLSDLSNAYKNRS